MWYLFQNGVFSNNPVEAVTPKVKTGIAHIIVGCCALGTTAAVLPTATSSQQNNAGGGGLETSFSVSQGISYSDNPDFLADPGSAEVRATTGLGFSLSSQTRTQRLTFGVNSGLQFSDDGFDIRDPRLTLGYGTDTRNAAFDLNGSYQRSRVGSFVLNADTPLDTTDLIFDEGTRTDFSYEIGAEIGRAAPFGASFNYAVTRREFSDTLDTNLFDLDTESFGAALRFDLSPRLRLSVGANRSEQEAEDVDQTTRVNTSFNIGLSVTLDDASSLSLGLNDTEIETTRLSGVTRTSGFGFNIDYSRQVQSGSFSLGYGSNEASSGRRDTFNFDRSIELTDGSLSFGFGLSKSEGLSAEPVARLAYSREGDTNRISVNLSQAASVDIDDNEFISTRLGASYSEDINGISSWGANLSISNIEALDGGNDQVRFDAGVNYSYALGNDWDLVSGYSFAYFDSDNSAERRSNTVSVSIQRSFSFRP